MRILIFFLLTTLTSFGQGLVKINSSIYLINSNYLILKDMDLEVDGTLVAKGTIKFTNGNFTMNGNFDSATGKFIFSNTTTHDHYLSTSSSSNNTFYDLTILGDVNTTYDLRLLSNVKVNNNLKIQSQKVNLNNNYIDLGTTGYIEDEGNGQYLYDDPDVGSGYIQVTSTIGDNTTVNPGNLGLEITTHSNQMGSTVIKRYHKKADVGSGLYGTHRIFDVTPTYNGYNYGGNLNVDLKFHYFNDMLGTISDAATLKLYRSGDGGSTWENKGGDVDVSNGYVTVTGFNQFSQVTIAPNNQTPLPIVLKYLKVSECKVNNILEWVTESEHNSDYFGIEWSTDGIYWREVGVVLAAGNSNEDLKYSYSHPISHLGLNYYRLIQYDFDGNWELYGPIYIQNIDLNKIVDKWINLLGQEVPFNTSGLIFKVYNDGSTSKTINY